MVLSAEEKKERNKESCKKYRENNKEKRKEYDKKYRENNKEQKKEYDKKYNQTDAGKKTGRISNWRVSGLICDDINSLYEYYINCNNCELCDIELVEGKFAANRRCLDHCHKTGLFRNVLCHSCNGKRRENNF